MIQQQPIDYPRLPQHELDGIRRQATRGLRRFYGGVIAALSVAALIWGYQ